MRVLKILCAGVLILSLTIAHLYCVYADNGKHNAIGRDNIDRDKDKPDKPDKIEDVKERREINHSLHSLKRDIGDIRELRQNHFIERKREIENVKERASQLREMQKKTPSKWSHNPNDVRGQGNMGRVNMLAPFGHNKNFDRKDYFGNRGRVIRNAEPEPVPLPEPIFDK